MSCPHCAFSVYSAAGNATADECPRCGRPLEAGGAGARAHALRAEIEQRLGRFPAFFEPAAANPDVLGELWRHTRLEWLESPVPAHFRHRLLASLASLSPWPWGAIAAESPAATALVAQPEATEWLEAMLAEPAVQGVDASPPLTDWPAPGSDADEELHALTLRLAIGRADRDARARLQWLLGRERYASLLAVLTYLEACRVFADANPELATPASGAGRAYRRAADFPDAAVFELDASGAVVSFSPGAEALFGYSAADVAGLPVGELFAAEFTQAVGRMAEQLAGAGDEGLLQQNLDVVGRRKDGTLFEAGLRLMSSQRTGGSGVAGVVFDIGARKQRQQYASSYGALLGILIGEEQSLAPAAVLEPLAESLGWDVAALWTLEPETSVLRCAAVLPLREGAPRVSDEIESVTLAPGEGLVGRVFETGEPVWAAELSNEPALSPEEAATRPGMRSAVWLPVVWGDEGVAVLELMSSEPRPTDSLLLDVLTGLAGEAGALRELDHARTERRRTAPGQAEHGAMLAFEGAPVGMALVSLEPGNEGRITQVNRAMAVLTGLDVPQLTNMSLRELTHPEDADVDASLMEQLVADRVPSYHVDKRFRRGPGDFFWGELSVSLIRAARAGRPLYAVVNLADVTERKRAENALRESRERFASVFDEAPVGMAICTLEGRWLQVNPALCEILGYDEAELLGKTLDELIHRDDVETVRRYLRQLLAGEVAGYRVETRTVDAGSHVIWIELGLSVVHDYDGEPTYVVAELTDVTERKRVQEELERGAMRDELTGVASRPLLLDHLEQARALLDRTGVPFAVLLVTVDGLDEVNERFGRARGDQALREMAARLGAAVRGGDTVGRYGDDQFMLVCEYLESPDEAAALAARIVELGRLAVGVGKAEVALSVTVGVTVAADPHDPIATLVDRADAARQAAKREGAAFAEYAPRD